MISENSKQTMHAIFNQTFDTYWAEELIGGQ